MSVASYVDMYTSAYQRHSPTVGLHAEGLALQYLSFIMETGFVRELKVEFCNDLACDFLSSLVKLESLEINIDSFIIFLGMACDTRCLQSTQVLHITSFQKCNYPPMNFVGCLMKHKLTEIVLDIKLPSKTIHGISCPTDVLVSSLLNSCLLLLRLSCPASLV